MIPDSFFQFSKIPLLLAPARGLENDVLKDLSEEGGFK
jgi:hypothetical protein